MSVSPLEASQAEVVLFGKCQSSSYGGALLFYRVHGGYSLRKRARSLGSINGCVTICGKADHMRERVAVGLCTQLASPLIGGDAATCNKFANALPARATDRMRKTRKRTHLVEGFRDQPSSQRGPTPFSAADGLLRPIRREETASSGPFGSLINERRARFSTGFSRSRSLGEVAGSGGVGECLAARNGWKLIGNSGILSSGSALLSDFGD